MLLVKQVGMRPSADERDLVGREPVDEKPIWLDVAFAEILPRASEFVIAMPSLEVLRIR